MPGAGGRRADDSGDLFVVDPGGAGQPLRPQQAGGRGGAVAPCCSNGGGGLCVSLAERLRQKVERHLFTSDEIRLHVTVSLGVTEIKEVDLSPSEIIHKADTALYEAKHQGRNKVVAG